MPTIEKRPTRQGDIAYRAKVRVKSHHTVTATFSRQDDAERWAYNTETSIRDGRFSPAIAAPNRVVGELIDRYITDVLPTKPRNARSQKSQLLWWKNKIGSVPLSQLRSSTITDCRDELLERKTPRGTRTSNATVVRYLAVLSHVFSIAEKDWNWIEHNPVRKVRKPKEARGRVRVLSPEELAALSSACLGSRSPFLYTIFVLAVSTGMRLGEIRSLRRKHVDLERSRVVLEDTKNGERRSVPLTGLALKLVAQRLQDVTESETLIFAKDGASKPTEIKKAWSTALRKAGVTNFRFHDTRHCAASYLLESGASIAQLAEILGHKTLQMVKRYAHLSDTKSAELVSAMTARVFGYSL